MTNEEYLLVNEAWRRSVGFNDSLTPWLAERILVKFRNGHYTGSLDDQVKGFHYHLTKLLTATKPKRNLPEWF